MDEELLRENERKRIRLPVGMLLCYSLFTAWQMGVVFFSGKALSIGGRTPLPISADGMGGVIVAAYLLSFVFLVFFQKRSVAAARIGLGISMASALALYLPLPDAALSALVAVQSFCCVFLTGVCISVAVNLFTEETELYDVLVTAVFADLLIAILQNDLLPVPYAVFRGFTAAALALLLFFFFRLPKTSWPEYAARDGGLVKPKRFFAGVYFLIGVTCMLTLFGNTVSEGVPHGVTVFSVSTALCGGAVFLLWKLPRLSPLRCGKFLIALGALGFLLAVAGPLHPALRYASCALLGCGNLACCLSSFYGIALMGRYPSRWITPTIILLAVATVLLHTVLLNAFRGDLSVLYLLYALLAVTAAIAYLLIEPHLLWTMQRPREAAGDVAPIPAEAAAGDAVRPSSRSFTVAELDALLSPHASGALAGQELRVAELILCGFTSREIAQAMRITQNTVKGYRKNLYAKLNVHSLRELFLLSGVAR